MHKIWNIFFQTIWQIYSTRKGRFIQDVYWL